MKKITAFVIALVMTITALVGTTSTAFAVGAIAPNGTVIDGDYPCLRANSTPANKTVYIKDLFTSGSYDSPESTGIFTIDYYTATVGDAGYIGTWSLHDGVCIITIDDPDGTNVRAGQCYTRYLTSPLYGNPYIETVIIVGGYLDTMCMSNCQNLKTVIVVDGEKIPNFLFGDTFTSYNFVNPAMLPTNTQRILGNIALHDYLPMVTWDSAYAGKPLGSGPKQNIQTYAGALQVCNATGKPSVNYCENAYLKDDAEYQRLAGFTVFGDQNDYKAYVQSVLDSIKLNDEARTLLAKYGYSVSGGNGTTPVAPTQPSVTTPVTGTPDKGTATTVPANQVPTTQPTGRKVSGWAADSVDKALSMNIGGNFEDSDCTVAITRAEFCKLAMATYSVIADPDYHWASPALLDENPFTDVDPADAIVITAANKLGIVNGYGGGKFGPNDLITREQAAVMLARLAEACGKPMTAKSVPFTDAISGWAATGVAQCYGAGVMNGTSKTTFDAYGNYTVEQSLVTMVRVVEYAAQ